MLYHKMMTEMNKELCEKVGMKEGRRGTKFYKNKIHKNPGHG